MDPYLITGLGLGVFGALAAFACWAADLFSQPDTDPDRTSYQHSIRMCIEMMVDCPWWDGDWTLQTLLYEYRHGA